MVINLVEDFVRHPQTGSDGHDQSGVAHGNSASAFRGMIVAAIRIVGKVKDKLFLDDRWMLGLGNRTEFMEKGTSILKPVTAPSDFFWADPFIITHHGKLFAFVEELPLRTGRGHLSCIPLDESGSPGEAVRILEKPYHLSYPNVFMMDGRWYMIPESSEHLTVDLFESEEFPFRWTHRKKIGRAHV